MTPFSLLLLLLLLKTLAVFAVSGLALLVLRRASASARHLVCLLTLVALLALPLFSLALPGWRLPVLKELTPRQVATLPRGEGEDRIGLAPARENPSPENPPPTPSLRRRGQELRNGSSSGPSPSGGGVGEGYFFALYLLGVLLAALRPLLGLRGIAHLRRICVPVTDAPTLALSADCAAVLRLSYPITLRAADVPVPMTWGWRRPVVLLPIEFLDWPHDRTEAVLLHEMAHIKRCDWLSHRFADCVCAVYWFHPLVWLTARRLRTEGEIACDDLVIASGIAAPDYARHLLDIARALPPSRSLQSAIAIAQTSQIEGRLTMILSKAQSRRPLTRRVFLAVLIPGIAVLITLAVLRPDVKARSASSSFSTNVDNAIMTLSNGVTVRLAGITDTQRSAVWWLPSGSQAAGTLPKNTLVYPNLPAKTQGRVFAVVETYTLASQPQVVWAATPRFSEMYQQIQPHLSVRRPNETWEVEPDDHKYALDHFQYEKPQGLRQISQTNIFPQAFEAQTQSCSVQYGVAAGPWTQSVNCAKIAGKTAIQTSSGPVIFTLFPNPHHLPPAQAARGNAVFMVTDRFADASPLRSENPTQTMLHDGENYERAVFALDSKGRVIDELAGGMNPGTDAEGKFKYEQLISVPNSLLKNVASFQLVVRPYQWVEFKNVALQPAKS